MPKNFLVSVLAREPVTPGNNGCVALCVEFTSAGSGLRKVHVHQPHSFISAPEWSLAPPVPERKQDVELPLQGGLRRVPAALQSRTPSQQLPSKDGG